MRIVHLTRDFPPVASGIGDHVARLAHELVGFGDEQVVVCDKALINYVDTFRKASTLLISQSADESVTGVSVLPSVERWDGAEPIIEAVRDARPDAIVWHYNPFQIGRRGVAPFAARLARALSSIAPLTLVAHELWYPWGRNGLRGLVWAITQRAQTRGVIAAANQVLVTTDARRADLVRLYPHMEAKIGVIAAGPTIEPNGDAPSKQDGAFVVAHVGAIGEGRDLRPAVDAVSRLRADGRDVRLLLVGRTGVAPPHEAFIETTGALDHAGLSAALASADAYLFAEPTGPTSRKTSLLSALAHGLPVVAYAGPDGEPHFRDEMNCLLVAPDAGAIASALRRLTDDAGLRQRLGHAARQMAAERYGWRGIAERVREAVMADAPRAEAGR